MKTTTTKKVIENLKEKIAERKSHVTDLYAEYAYKNAIQQVVDEKLPNKSQSDTNLF